MKQWLAVLACLLIDGVTVGRVWAQQTAPKSSRVLSVRSGGYLGVGVADIDEDRAKILKLPETRGVEINVVLSGSPAAKAGLLKGDVVLEFNGQRVEGTDQFIRMVRETSSGHKITLQIIRNGAPQTLTATVGAHESGGVWPVPDGDSWNFSMPAMPQMPVMPRMPVTPRAPMFRWQNDAVGVEAESLSGQLADYFGVKEGVLIRSVLRNSPADKGGLKAGDVVVKVNGEVVTAPGEISLHVHNSSGKRSIPFVVMRNHREMSLQVTVDDGGRDSDKGEN